MIILDNVSKYYPTKFGRNYVLRDVSITLPQDRNIGILGVNGAGKSTLLRLLGGMDTPNQGKVTRHCRVSWPLALSGGFQGSMTGRENTRFVCRIHGVRDTQEVEEWVKEFSEIGKHFELPIKTYSSGMQVRLAFAVATSVDPDILIVDETLSVGDVFFQQKCEDRIQHFIQSGDVTVLFVSHSMEQVERICQRAVWIEKGDLRMDGPVDEVCKAYREQFN